MARRAAEPPPPPRPAPPPDVSVVVVNYDGGGFTPACLESIPADAETIVVDNGSKDGSPEAIASRFPSAVLLRNPVNRGFAAAVNQGIAVARGRHICLLNNDARLSPEALPALVAYLDAHPEAGMVAPQLLHEDGRRQHSFDNLPSLATAFLNKSLLRLLLPGRFPSKKQEVAEPLEVESVIGACMLVRRSLIDRIGTLDEGYFLFLEETDWCLRAREAGSKVVFVPAAKVVHLQGRTRDRVRVRGRIEYTRSFFTYFRKNRPASSPLLRALFPLRTLIEFVFQTLALFLPSVRRRWVETAAVLAWQACGCPRKWGLSTGADPKYLKLVDGSRVAEEHMEAFNEFDRKRDKARLVRDGRYKRTLVYNGYLIKAYKQPGMKRVKALLFGSRADREFRVSLELQKRSVPAVPVAAARGGGAEPWVAFRKLEGWRQLQETLLDAATPDSERRRLCFLYGRFARRLLDAGVRQYDFNPSNVLVRGVEFRLIDFERMKLLGGRVPEDERIYLLSKMNRIEDLPRTDRLRFLRGYADSSARDRSRLHELARAVLARGERQAEGDADRAGRRCVEENRDFGRFLIGEASGHYRKRRPEREDGLSREELQAVAEGRLEGFRTQEAADGLSAWREAQRARDGAQALVLRKGGPAGLLVYRAGVPSVPVESPNSGTSGAGKP
jgi:hypothetical protein